MKAGWKPELMLLPICAVSLAFSLLQLTGGHNWGDDFAGYILQAQSIIEGDVGNFMRRNESTITDSSYRMAPIAYPWAYPLTLSSLYALFGLNVIAFKLAGILFYQAFIVSLFFLIRRKIPWQESVAITLFLALNPNLLRYLNDIGSDLQFLFLSTASLLFMDRLYADPNPSRTPVRDSFILGMLIGLAFCTRPNGILLLGALLAIQLFQWIGRIEKRSLSLKIQILPYVAFLIPTLLFATIFPVAAESRLEYLLTASIKHFQRNIINNFIEFGSIYYAFYLPGLLYFLSICFFVTGVIRGWKEIHLITYAFLTLMLYSVWEAPQGFRFLLPFVPIFFCFVGIGLTASLRWIPKQAQKTARVLLIAGMGIVSVVAFRNDWRLSVSNLAAGRSQSGPFDPLSKNMFQYVQENTHSKDIIAFFKPRAMRLMTGRDSVLLMNCGEMKKATVLVLHKSFGEYDQLTYNQAMNCPVVHLKPVFENENFHVFSIGPVDRKLTSSHELTD